MHNFALFRFVIRVSFTVNEFSHSSLRFSIVHYVRSHLKDFNFSSFVPVAIQRL